MVGYSLWGRKERLPTEQLHFHFHFSLLGQDIEHQGKKKQKEKEEFLNREIKL